MAHVEIKLDAEGQPVTAEMFLAAVERAKNEDRMTYVTASGNRVAAIVPLGVAVALDPESAAQPAAG